MDASSLSRPVENMTLEESRQELVTCLVHDPNRAVAIMQKFPNLAGERFLFPGTTEFLVHPLLHLVDKHPDKLETIKHIFELYPSAIREEPYCICLATKHTGNKETLLYLLKQDPDILAIDDFEFTTLIHYIVQCEPEDSSKLILDHYPHLHSLKDRDGRYLLNCCMQSEDNHDEEFATYMAARFPKDISALSFGHDFDPVLYDPACMGVIQMEAILKIVPQLKELDLTCVEWKDGAMLRFLNALKDFRSLENLSFLADRQVFGANAALHELLQQSLAANKSIRELTVQGAMPRRWEDGELDESEAITYSNALFNTILRGVEQMPDIDSLELHIFSVSDSQSILSFLANGGARRVELRDVAIAGSSPPQNLNWGNSRLENFLLEDTMCSSPRLNVTRGTLSTESLLNEMCREISKAPLGCVYLCAGDQPGAEELKDMTRGVLHLLRNPTLGYLCLLDATVDADQVAEALKENNTLEVLSVKQAFADETEQSLLLSVLKNHNTTLTNVNLYDPSKRAMLKGTKLVQEIDYWTHLNTCGRKQVRDRSTKFHQFLYLLGKATKVPEENDDSDDPDGLRLFNCQYGLLWEMPSLWSCPPPVTVHSGSSGKKTGKRKRSDD